MGIHGDGGGAKDAAHEYGGNVEELEKEGLKLADTHREGGVGVEMERHIQRVTAHKAPFLAQ